MEQVRHHVEEEEQDWFPKVRAAMPRRIAPVAPRTEASAACVSRAAVGQAQGEAGRSALRINSTSRRSDAAAVQRRRSATERA